MNHAMFDIDGTLVQSKSFEDECYKLAVKEITGLEINADWSTYPHATDSGILKTFIQRQAPDWELSSLEVQVKSSFINHINNHLSSTTIHAIEGAKEFIARLRLDENCTVSVATGGWKETALLKLKHAGFDTNDLILSSSNDHYSRTEIMKLSAKKVGADKDMNFTYFGDAEWDVKACRELNVNLVLIGNQTSHFQNVPNFKNQDRIYDYITG